MMDMSSNSKASFEVIPSQSKTADEKGSSAATAAAAAGGGKCLNRFLSKTYHMTNSKDPDCKSVMWCPDDDGRSFVIVDVDEFSNKVLPKFFKHSKLSSFVRQLNFYGFRKMRTERSASTSGSSSAFKEDESASISDDEHESGGEEDNGSASATQPQTNSGGKKKGSSSGTTVRFYHEYFRADRPDLLQKIQRATKSAEPPNPSHIENLKSQVESLKAQIETMSSDFDTKLIKMKTAMELNYERRIAAVENSYKDLLSLIVRDRFPQSSPSSSSGGTSRDRSAGTGSSISDASSLLALRAAAAASAGGDHQLFGRPSLLGGLGGHMGHNHQLRQQQQNEDLFRHRELLSSLTGRAAMGGGSGYVPDFFGHSLPSSSASSAISRLLVNGSPAAAFQHHTG